MELRFEWDESKRLSNLEKHGLDFLDVYIVFEAAHVEVPSLQPGEVRYLAIGMLEERCVTIIYTMRDGIIRVISFRRARNEESGKYQDLYGSRT